MASSIDDVRSDIDDLTEGHSAAQRARRLPPRATSGGLVFFDRRGAIPSIAPARVRAEPADHFAAIIGGSALLRQAVHRARMLANLDTAVLLQGETGVGKELFARAIHEGGGRRQGALVCVDCRGVTLATV